MSVNALTTRGPDSRIGCVVLAALLGLAPGGAAALEIGARAGTKIGSGADFRSTEFYVRGALPWELGDFERWTLTPHGEAAGGELRVDGESLTMGSLTIGLWATPTAYPVRFSIGAGPSYISESEMGGTQFGGRWQFNSHIGATLILSPRLAIGYRLQHTSNGGMYDRNQGFDQQTLEVLIGF